jgi:DNA replication protein
MAPFSGFSEGKSRLTPIPAQFFTELLPEIDTLAELKVALYAIWKLDRMEGTFRCLMREDFCEDPLFMKSLSKQRALAEAALDEALEKACARGLFLKADVESGETTLSLYFLNSPKGRAAVEAVQQGSWRPGGATGGAVTLAVERPNIYRLYEENIGPLTPLIADALREAEASYPQPWIEEAFRIAVQNNKRSWKYIEAILRRWQEGGRDEQNRRDSEEVRRRYAEWENPSP